MDRQPLVSVVIPVYNGANYVREAIESALNQTYKNIEIIVVNDGSTDNTEEICLSYGDKIRYFAKENGGVSTALNLGIKNMKGEYFSWLSHDDFHYPTKIESQIKACLEKKVLMCFSAFEYLNDYNKTKFTLRVLDYYDYEQVTSNYFGMLMHLFTLGISLIHKSVFAKVGMFDERLRTTQDYDWFIKATQAIKFTYTNEPLGFIREHQTRDSKTVNTLMMQEKANDNLKLLRNESDDIVLSLFEEKFLFYLYFYSYYYNNIAEYEEEAKLLFYENKNANFDKYREKVIYRINSLTKNKHKRLCIFGVGRWGKQALLKLDALNIPVGIVCDNNTDKCGKVFFGKTCISVEELEKYKEDTLVIVTPMMPQDIVLQLEELGFENIVTMYDLDSAIYKNREEPYVLKEEETST